jgi:pentatricopeptide repeat protein
MSPAIIDIIALQSININKQLASNFIRIFPIASSMRTRGQIHELLYEYFKNILMSSSSSPSGVDVDMIKRWASMYRKQGNIRPVEDICRLVESWRPYSSGGGISGGVRGQDAQSSSSSISSSLVRNDLLNTFYEMFVIDAGKLGKPGSFWVLLRSMRDKGITPSTTFYQAGMGGFIHYRRYTEALNVYSHMQAEGIEPSNKMLCYQGDALVGTGQPEKAAAIIKQAFADPSLHVDYFWWELLLKVCKMKEDYQYAVEILDRMQKVSGLKPKIKHYNMAMAAHPADKVEGIREVMNKAEQNRVPLNEISYQRLLSAYATQGQIGKCIDVLNEIESKGLRCEVHHFGSLLYGTARSTPQDTQRALDMMLQRPFPDSAMFVAFNIYMLAMMDHWFAGDKKENNLLKKVQEVCETRVMRLTRNVPNHKWRAQQEYHGRIGMDLHGCNSYSAQVIVLLTVQDLVRQYLHHATGSNMQNHPFQAPGLAVLVGKGRGSDINQPCMSPSSRSPSSSPSSSSSSFSSSSIYEKIGQGPLYHHCRAALDRLGLQSSTPKSEDAVFVSSYDVQRLVEEMAERQGGRVFTLAEMKDFIVKV